jgi:peptidoglycan hydrolase-like protein with peptidoglycan-binding domain
MRKATHLALTLLVTAGLGVFAGAARAQTKSAAGSSSGTSKSGSATRHKKSTKHSSKSSARERGQKAPTPERVSEIQQALAKDGSFSGAPNGKWDESTVEAMKKFQEGHGLNPSGKLDAKTLQKLGLGSQTAGVAAPMPPMSSSSAVTNIPSQTAHKQQ